MGAGLMNFSVIEGSKDELADGADIASLRDDIV